MVAPISFTTPGVARAPNIPAGDSSRAAPARPGGFAQELQTAMKAPAQPVRFSAHAAQRLEQRGVSLSRDDMARMAEAVDAAAAKGARDAVLLMDSLALVVNVPNRTVVTLVPADEAAPTVFTQIDSAVVVRRPADTNTSPGLDPSREAPRPLIDRGGRMQEGM